MVTTSMSYQSKEFELVSTSLGQVKPQKPSGVDFHSVLREVQLVGIFERFVCLNIIGLPRLCPKTKRKDANRPRNLIVPFQPLKIL